MPADRPRWTPESSEEYFGEDPIHPETARHIVARGREIERDADERAPIAYQFAAAEEAGIPRGRWFDHIVRTAVPFEPKGTGRG